MRLRTFLFAPENLCVAVFGLMVMTQAWLLVGFMQHRPDAPAPPPQQQPAPPRIEATPPTSF
jgi:hypothetical protein